MLGEGLMDQNGKDALKLLTLSGGLKSKTTSLQVELTLVTGSKHFCLML